MLHCFFRRHVCLSSLRHASYHLPPAKLCSATLTNSGNPGGDFTLRLYQNKCLRNYFTGTCRLQAFHISYAGLWSLCQFFKLLHNINCFYYYQEKFILSCYYQEPIKWSLHLPYMPLESTLSRVDL